MTKQNCVSDQQQLKCSHISKKAIVNSVAMYKAQLPSSFLLLNTFAKSFALMLNYRLHGFLLKLLIPPPKICRTVVDVTTILVGKCTLALVISGLSPDICMAQH